jgi:hypothetical protein
MPAPERQDQRTQRTYGIGEWYGRLFAGLAPEQRTELAGHASKPPGKHTPGCPFTGRNPCTKRGGVCSLQSYVITLTADGSPAHVAELGPLVTTCPERFQEGKIVTRWVSEVLLGCSEPFIVGEVDFLQRPQPTESGNHGRAQVRATDSGPEPGVGRIDCVLVAPGHDPELRWCALEIQAVYFSGDSMSVEFGNIRSWPDDSIPPPVGRRRPDWRSSGPKRLMPQLQIKVPSLRRWGKKMAVVVDEQFFASLSPMDEVSDVSNGDIAWFVVAYDQAETTARLSPKAVHITTLERAVEGLTAGIPVSLAEFERRIRAKLGRVD